MQRKHRKAINLIPPLDPKNIYKYLKEKFGHFLLSVMTLNTADTTIPIPFMSHSESQLHYSACDTSKSSHYKAPNTNSVAWEYEIVTYLRGHALSKFIAQTWTLGAAVRTPKDLKFSWIRYTARDPTTVSCICVYYTVVNNSQTFQQASYPLHPPKMS
jgi:hypothetical protein